MGALKAFDKHKSKNCFILSLSKIVVDKTNPTRVITGNSNAHSIGPSILS
jgi:hypothetical protein